MLSAGAGRLERIDLQIARANLDLGIVVVDLRKHRDRRRTGVDASLRLGFRYPLHAMDAGLMLEPAIRPFPTRAENDFAIAAGVVEVLGCQLDAHSERFGKTHVHARQIPSKNAGFVAAGAGANLDENVPVVVGVAGKHQLGKFAFEFAGTVAERARLVLREFPQLAVALVREAIAGRNLAFGLPKASECLYRGLELRALLNERGVSRLIEGARGMREFGFDFVEPPQHRIEPGGQGVVQETCAAAFLRAARTAASSCFFLAAAARWLNLSTRPAVSISFCCPVKSGWQAAQISTPISGRVEPVVKVLPQAQCTRASGYHLGWIFSFTAYVVYQGSQVAPERYGGP